MSIKTFNDGMSLRSNEIRVSFPHLFEKETAGMYPSNKYCLTAEMDAELVTACREAIKKRYEWAVQNRPEWKGKKPADLTVTKIKEKEGVAGVSVANLRTQLKPTVIDNRKQAITNPDEVYGGMYAIITIDTFAWGNASKGGVSLSLGGVVQKTRDGQRYGGGESSNLDLFDVVEDDTFIGGTPTAQLPPQDHQLPPQDPQHLQGLGIQGTPDLPF